MRVIALSGWRGSGKDTAADYLVQEHGYSQLSFASVLKDTVAEQYGFPRRWCDDREMKDAALVGYPVVSSDPFTAAIHQLLASELDSGYWTPRALCILEGSTRRSVRANHWVEPIVNYIRRHDYDDGFKFVISDLRYTSEADVLQLLVPEIQLVRIERADSIGTTDPSERDLDNYKFDYRVSNRGTKEMMYETLDSIITGHRPF